MIMSQEVRSLDFAKLNTTDHNRVLTRNFQRIPTKTHITSIENCKQSFSPTKR